MFKRLVTNDDAHRRRSGVGGGVGWDFRQRVRIEGDRIDTSSRHHSAFATGHVTRTLAFRARQLSLSDAGEVDRT